MRRVVLFVAFTFYFSANAIAQSPKPATRPDTKAVATPAAKPAASPATRIDAAHPPATPSPIALNAARASFAKLPLSFEENSGQTDRRVKFTSRGAGYNLFLTGNEAVFALRDGSAAAKCSPLSGSAAASCMKAAQHNASNESVLWMKLRGANSTAQISASDPLPGKINYYMGNDHSKWRTGVRQYGRVNYSGIYPGVDLTYYGNQQQLESDFILAPGANPNTIEFEVKGARESRLDAQGNLILATRAGNVQLLRPGIYQLINGHRRNISGSYVLRAQNRVGFAVGSYDKHEKLIIDPTLVYSTFLGGSNLSGGDSAQAIAIDSTGHAYVTGQGMSADFPGSDTSGPPAAALSDFVFITEFDTNGSSAGTSLIYSTILSGSSGYIEVGNGIGVDASGNAYVAGSTDAPNFPMVNPFQATYGAPVQTGFVAGLSAGNGTLIYSTFFGGRNATDTTELQNLVADSTGNTYVVGDTQSPNFPTVAPLYATLAGTQNVVVAKFNPQGQPLYSTYLGGNSYDYGTAIAADASGNAYVTGYTSSNNFPLQTAFQSTFGGGYDVFVSKLSFSGSTLSLAASSYLGGSNTDEAMGIAVDTATPPNVYVTGQTSSSGAAPAGFPTTTGVFSTANGGGTDAFVTKIKGDFTALTYSTYLGGTGTDIGYAIGLDGSGNAYVTGSTTSTNFPLKTPLQSAIGAASATNVFLTQLNAAGAALGYSTYLGGTAIDSAFGIAVDSTGNAYIAGKTTSPNFPVATGGAAGTSPFQGQLGGSAGNAFVAKISPAAAPSALNFFPPSYNFHSDGLGTSLIENVTLSNNTAAVATVSGFAFGGANSGDFSFTAAQTPCLTTGSFSLPAGASCVLTVKFAPQDQDARTGTLTVTYNSTSTAVMNLSGTGGAPEVSLSTTNIAFGNDPLNVVDSYSIGVTNTGGATLQIGSAQISASTPANAAPYSILTSSSSCFSAAVAPGNSCYIDVQFLPTTTGTFNASILINSNAAGSPATVTASGTGVREVVVEPTSLELGIQIAGSTSTNNQNEAYVINGSGETISLTVTPGTGTDQGDFHINNINGLTSCATVGSLAPGGTCYLVVLFQPTAASAPDGRTGSYLFAWQGSSNSVVPGSQVVNVMGTGITGISLYTNSVTGPNEYVGFTEGSAGLEYIANGTPSAITVTTALSGNNPGDFTATIDPNCAPAGVVPAETYCRVSLTFTPSAIGLRSAAVAFNYTGASSGQLLLTLQGTGIPGPVIIESTANGYLSQTSSIAFGSQIINETTPEKYFIVRNVATTPLNVQSMTGPTNTDFKIASDSTCTPSKTPFTIPGGGSCTIGVTFTPSSTGTLESTTIVMTDAYTSTNGADSASPHTLTLTGIGEPAAITVSVSTGGTSLLDFGNVQVNPTTIPQAAIYLTNGGATSITIPTGGGAVLASGGSAAFAPLVTTAGVLNKTTCVDGAILLPHGGTCVIGVKFNPTALGMQTSSVTFSDPVLGSHTVNIQGNGVGQGSISTSTTKLVTSSSFTFTQLVGTTSAAQLATVANIGSGPLTITSLTSSGTNASSFTVSAPTAPTPLCAVGLVIAAGGTCQMSVTFTAPATTGYSIDDVTIRADLGNNATGYVYVSFSGQAVAGGFSLSPAGPIALGSVAVGSTATSNFYYLTNNNLTSVTFGQMTVPTGYSIVTDSCSLATVTAANECYFEISFAPASGIAYNGNLTLPYTGATGTPYTVAITGTGSTAVVANPNPVTFTFASVGSASLSQVTISNGSASPATITGISGFTGANATDFSIPTIYNGCPSLTVLNPGGGSCSIEVQFLSSVSGNFTAQFTVSYTIGGIAQPQITVVANASIPFSIVTATPSPLVFSTQTVNTQSQTMFVTLANSASATQTAYVSTVQISGNDFSLASPGIGNCYSIAAGSSCTLPIAFTPSASGARTGTLTITDNSTTSPHVINLQGTGVAGTVSASPTSLNFPVTNVGASVTAGAVLSNTTGSTITVNSVVFSGPYATDTGSGTCVNGNKVGSVTGSCVVYIKFTPSGVTNAGSATVNYTVGAGPTTGSVVITLSGAGTNPNVNVNPTSIVFGATAVNTSSAAQPVTVSNPTSSAVSITALPSITGTNASDFTLGTNGCTNGFSLVATTGSCVANVIFHPGVTGGNSRSATLTITNSSSNGTLAVALSGTATQPVANLNNSTISFGSLNTGITSSQQLVTLTNTGNGTLNISSVVLGGTNPGDFAQATPASGTDCRTVGTLAATASCNVAATFTPTANGSRTATITITDNATPTTQVITLTGTGTLPAVTLAPTTIALGNQFLSTTSAQFTSVLTNSGNGPLTITSVAIDNTSGNFADFALVTPSGSGVADCRTTTTLPALSTCTIAATFTPSAIGARTATVKITDSAAGSPHLLPLTGTGTAPIVSLNPTTTLAFGNEIDGVKSASQIVTLTNIGTASLTLASAIIDPASTNAGDFAIVSGSGTTCTAGLVISSTAGSNSCTVTLTFTPGAAGARSASLKFTDNSNGTTGSTQSVSLTGTGQTPPTATIAPTSVPFPNQRQGTSSAATTVTITNNGDATLSIASIALDAAGNPGDFILAAGATTPCPLAGGNVSGHASCTFTVAFKPTATGARAGTVDITDNGNATGTAGTKQTVALSGNGIAPNAQVAATLAFGNQPINQTSTMALTLTNNGNDTLNLASSGAVAITVGTNSTLFGIAGTSTCVNGLAIPASGSCTINVTFTPTAVGNFGPVTLVITDDSGTIAGTKQSVALSGSGVTASVNFSPSPVNFTPSQNVGTTSSNVPVTLTNSGGLAVQLAASNAVAISGTNASDFAIVSTGTTCINNAAVGASGGSCVIQLTFTPSGAGSRTATLTVTDNANPTTQTVTLNGTGIAPIASLNPATTLAFGNEIDGVKSASQVVTLTNIGTASLTLASAVIDPASTNAGDFAIVSGSGTTCTAGLVISSTAGSNSCTVTLTFTPGAAGARSASLKFTDNSNGTTGSTQSVSLTGTGQTPPTATIAPTSVPFPNQRQGTSSAATTVTITNNGDATLSIASIALDAAGNPGDFILAAGATTPCPLAGGNVSGHASCTFTVAFKPTATGARAGTVDITDNGNATGTAGTKQTVALSGNGTAPSVQLVSALAFNNQPVNLTATLPITLKNNGTDTLNLAANAMAITASADSSFFGIGTSGQGTTCANSSAIAAGSTCTIVVTFSPTTARSYGPVTLVITDDAGAVAGSTQSVSITGAGVTSTVNFNPTSISFGSQRTGVASAQMTSLLTNSASTALTITGVTLAGTNPGDFTLVAPASGTDCRTVGSVPAAGTCTIAVTFTPTATGGRSATVSVADSATGSPHTFTLTGTGTAPAVSLSSSTVTFANQIQSTTSSAQTVTLTNTGTAVLNISTVALGGTNPGDFVIVPGSGSTCAGAAVGFTAPNNTCTIALTFAPATANPFTATLTFTDDASPTTQMVNLSGTGVTPPTATPSPTSLTFTSQATTTTSAAQTITLSNTGGAPLSITSIALAGTNSADFAFASPATTCPTSAAGQVAAGSSCVLSVTFSPKAPGARTANIAILVTGIANPAAIALTGTGTAPDLAIAKTHVGSFEVGVNNTYAIKLTNNGTAPTQQQITVTDTLPAGLSYVSASPAGWSCSANAQVVTCTNAGPIANGANTTLTLTVSVAAAAYPSVTNSATVADAGDSGTNDKSSTDVPTVVTAPDVTITSTHAGDFTVGTNGNYTIKVTNTGTGPTTGNVVVVDTLPANLSFVSAAGTGWACTAGAQNSQAITCTYSGAALAATGGNSSFTLVAAVAPGAFPSVINNATVSDPNDGKTTDKSTAPDTTNIDNVVPTQASFTPNLGLIAGATTAQQVVITGTGFNSSTQVTLGTAAPLNTPLTGTANAAGTQLTISIPVADLAAANAGTLTLTVTNPKNPTTTQGGGVAATTQSFPLVAMQAIAPASGTPAPVPVVAGTPYMLQMNLNLTPSGAVLPADVTITCAFPAGLTGATCSPSPATIAHGTTAANATTTITINAVPTKNGSSAPPSSWHNNRPWPVYFMSLAAMCLLAMLTMFGSVRQRVLQLRQAPMYLVLGVLLVAAGALVGCAPSGPTPTPVGPSTITVTATTADGASVTTTVNINVSN